MQTRWKVALVVGGVLILVMVAAAVVGVYLLRRHGPALVESGRRAHDEGAEYGRRTDNEGCLTEAVARHARAEGFGDLIKINLFLRSCLDASRETHGFCDDVPRPVEFVKSAQWQLRECRRHGLSHESQCGQLFAQVQQFCESRRAAAK